MQGADIDFEEQFSKVVPGGHKSTIIRRLSVFDDQNEENLPVAANLLEEDKNLETIETVLQRSSDNIDQ